MIACLSICKIAALKSSSHNFNVCLILVLLSVEYPLPPRNHACEWGQMTRREVGAKSPLSWTRGRLEAALFLPVAWFPGRWSWEDKSPPEAGMQVEEVRGNHYGMGNRWEA